MKNLENKIKAVKTDRDVLNQFTISLQIGSAMNSNDPDFLYVEFKGNKSETLKEFKSYANMLKSRMFEAEGSFLAYLSCETKDRRYNMTDVFKMKIQVS